MRIWCQANRLLVVEMFKAKNKNFYNPFHAFLLSHRTDIHSSETEKNISDLQTFHVDKSWKIYVKSFSLNRFRGGRKLHERRNENCFKVNDFSSAVERLKDQTKITLGCGREKKLLQLPGRNKELRLCLVSFCKQFFIPNGETFNCETFFSLSENRKKCEAINSRQQFSAFFNWRWNGKMRLSAIVVFWNNWLSVAIFLINY